MNTLTGHGTIRPAAIVVLVKIGDRVFITDDAVNAAAVLAETDAGHEEAAESLANRAGLEGLTNGELEALADAFGVERG